MTTLKASGGGGVGGVIAYYEGLAQDQRSRKGAGRGPVDYYLDPDEPAGRWWGSGREALDLDGEVAPEQLRALLEARHPSTGAKLGRGFRERSARGFDATFSAPKSVSVLWALSEDPFVRAEVLAAHDAAVATALAWLERHGAVTRRGRDGVDQVDTKGLTVGVFRQHTSRTADPELHTHAVIAAKVQDPTGRWLSLDARFLKRQQRSIGWIYDAALRSELTARLGVAWEPLALGCGQADIDGVSEELRRLFSQRSQQVDEKLAELVSRWSDEHDGAEPDQWVVAELTRTAVLASRPPKQHGTAAEALHREWRDRTAAEGFAAVRLPDGEPHPPGLTDWDPDTVVNEAVERVAGESSTWLHADLARELAALVPPDATTDGTAHTALIDELAKQAATRCVELHPPAHAHIAQRRNGRPASEHVTDRRLTTRAVLDQEARILQWAETAVDAHATTASVAEGGLDHAQRGAAEAVAGLARLTLVVGPAGAGKTTALGTATRSLQRQGRPVVGLAPSGKAADVLGDETSLPTVTLAKLLHEHRRPGGPLRAWRLPEGTTVILDEASMATTDDLDQLVSLTRRHRWRLVLTGDPEQLRAVGRGGMFTRLCDTLPTCHLEGIRRFDESWQADASRKLRDGDPDAASDYAAHGRVRGVHPGALADQIARQHQRLTDRGQSVAITTASQGTALAINIEIQRRRHPRHDQRSTELHDTTRVFEGDRIATRRNHPHLETTSGTRVRNRHTWTVTAVHPDGSLTVEDPTRGASTLPASYVARHVELGWAVTGYGTQGLTTDHSITVVEPSASRAHLYVGMTRGRHRNIAWIPDPTDTLDPRETLADIIQRPTRALSAHTIAEQLGTDPTTLRADALDLDDPTRRMRQRVERLRTRRRGGPRLSR